MITLNNRMRAITSPRVGRVGCGSNSTERRSAMTSAGLFYKGTCVLYAKMLRKAWAPYLKEISILSVTKSQAPPKPTPARPCSKEGEVTVHGHQLLAIVLRELANFIHPNGQDLPSQMLRIDPQLRRFSISSVCSANLRTQASEMDDKDHFDGVQHFLLLVRSVIHTLHHPLHARSHQHQVVLHRVARRALADKFLCLHPRDWQIPCVR